jgi:hypothetical protein
MRERERDIAIEEETSADGVSAGDPNLLPLNGHTHLTAEEGNVFRRSPLTHHLTSPEHDSPKF